MQTRLHLQLGQMVEQAQKWEVSVPTHLDHKDLSPRWVLGGDDNMVPDSLPLGLVFTTPRGMPTVSASRRTLDGFILDPLTARTFNPVVRLVNVDPAVSDHNVVSLLLEEY